MKKRLVAFYLVLIMVLGMLPVSAFAADDGVSPQALESNETQTIKYQILYVGDEFNTGYNYGVSVNKTYTCQYSTGHSGFNHSILISEFRNVGVPALKGQLDSGYEFVGWAKEAKKNPTIFDFNTAGTTATQTTYTIYLVAKKTNPTPTYMYYLYYKYNDGTDSTWLTDVTDRPTAATTFTFNVNRAKLTRSGYDHIGWADKADAVTAKYTGGDPIVLTKDNPTKTIYAIWMPFFELKYDANGGTGAPASQTRTAAHPTVNRVTFTVPNQTPSKEGYTFKDWADSATATDAQYQPGGPIAVKHENSPKTVYAVWQSNTPPIDKPDKPTENDVTGVVVDIVCVTTTGTHDTVQYLLGYPTDAQHTIGEVASDGAGGYICPVTVRTAWFVQQASNLVWKVQHTPTAQTITFNLTYDKNSKTWVKPAANPRIEATHEVTPPRKPALNEGSPVCVQCEKTNSIHVQNGKDYARMYFGVSDSTRYTEVLKDGKNVWKDDNGVWTYQIKLKKDKYIEAFNTTPLINSEHTDLYPDQDAYVTWKRDGNQWKIVPVSPNQSGIGAVINVTCKLKAPTADELKKLDMAVQVKCVVDAAQQHTSAYGLLGEYDKDYFVGEPKKVGDDWLCDISYDPDPYVAAFNKAFPTPKHIQNDEKIVPVTLIWVGGSWQIKTQGRVLVTEVYTVTFDSYGGTPVPPAQEVEYGLTATKPADPTLKGYTFDGWYLDGEEEPFDFGTTITSDITLTAKWEINKYTVTFDSYGGSKVDPQVVEYGLYAQEPEEPTLKGFTFAYWYLDDENEAYDFENTPVTADITLTAKWEINKYTVTFDSYGGSKVDPQVVEYGLYAQEPEEPTLKGFTFAYWYLDDENEAYDFENTPVTADITLTAKWNINKYTVAFNTDGGTPVPPAQEVEYGLTTTEPAAPEKTGYTFDGWYLGDEKYDFSAAVEQNITLTAKWHVTPHNIYAYARLNSYFAPLTTSEFDTPVTLNEATLSRLGLGSYNSLGYISIGSFTFDAMPLTSDLYFGDDAELSAVAEKLATDIALETGVSDKIVEKIAWTALYKTVNEEDMEPGYPAEAGYQLSGNLNLASVTFRAGAENVENMPAVNYTYDDGAIDFYDFYFAGDTITLPTTEPTREGYSFKGWSVEVIPAENDADHLDADGADDAADETLLKAGDTYTITAGGVIFTAQWQKKTFTVKYYLPDETGAWVEKKMDTVDSVDYATYSLWTPNAEDGYEFSGWYQKPADIGVKAKVEKLYMAKEWKLYGKFTPIEYTIQYVYNDGKATSTNPTTYTVESDTITLADATGADWGKTFLEWHDENGQKITEIPTGSTGDRVITAYWNWPVHLHYLDKDNNEIDSATLYVSELEPGACVLPTGEKTGYDFDGWYEAKKDIGTASHKLNALSIAKKWELYGRYTAKTDVSYTVKYLREGDNKVLAPEKVVTDQTFDTEVTEQAADVVGYTPDAPSKTMILDEYNKVLTFSYSANTYDYTVRHIKQLPDGSYDEANAEVETLSGKFEALAAVTAKDYGEHYPTNDAGTKQNIKIEKGLTIDVKYDLDEHTLTFETNGGSAINSVTVRHGNAVARPADPTKDKYTFIGWYADPEFTEEYDFATVLEADKTIYAKFELTSTPIGDIYVRYDVLHIKQLPDGTYDLANAEVEHLSAKKDTTVTAVAKNYSATHHFFNSKLGTLTGTAIQPYMGVDGKPVYTILSVYYDLDFHTLTFDTMGGSKIAPETVRHGLTVAKPKDPVNGGFLFDGWYTDKTYRTPYNFATPLTQDTTIYAKWFLIVLPGVTVKKNTPKLNTADHFAYVQGYPDGTVKPAGNITRAETAAILFRLMDDASRKTYYSTKSGFRDVASGSWYNTYVATLNNAGVITDSSNGCFRPNEAITRAELAAMLAKFSETTGAANYFNDVSAKYWAANAIAICAKLGWITGYPDGTFRPDRNVTRAELMAMINRATGRAPKSADAFLPGMKTWIDNTSDKWYYLDVQEATNSHSYTVKGSETWTALTSDPNWSLYE
ncbi:MAG: InlB B-repeat-containing protein [Oscillospiraceae bacterium]